jgi:hypothetical protein
MDKLTKITMAAGIPATLREPTARFRPVHFALISAKSLNSPTRRRTPAAAVTKHGRRAGSAEAGRAAGKDVGFLRSSNSVPLP